MLRGDATIAAHVDAFTARNLEQGGTQPPPAKQPKLGPKPEPTLDDTVEPRRTKPPTAAADAAGALPLAATSSVVTPPSPSSSCTTAAAADADAAASPRRERATP